MPTNFPGALDALTNPTSGSALTSPSHAAQHANANDAIEAIEAHLLSGGVLEKRQSYVGRTTVGASAFDLLQRRMLAKAAVLATPGFLASVDVHIKGNTANVESLAAAVFNNSAGNPGSIVALGAVGRSLSLYLNSAYRWLSIPVGVWLSAGTYHLVIQDLNDNVGAFTVAYDASVGSDRTATPSGDWLSENDVWSNSGHDFSIRGTLLR